MNVGYLTGKFAAMTNLRAMGILLHNQRYGASRACQATPWRIGRWILALLAREGDGGEACASSAAPSVGVAVAVFRARAPIRDPIRDTEGRPRARPEAA